LAKDDLEKVAREIDLRLKRNGAGRALVCVNKALVTQASSAIPVVPLYISILYKIMKNKGLHEGCIEQIYRLFSGSMYAASGAILDREGRVRLDDWEMRPDVQQAVAEIWPTITTENLNDLADFAGYRADFLKIFGFGLNAVDYAAHVDPQWPML
jgi:enoyl-[acyl-carrier protein] reductase/trans-2-enoyl-CoA reductase (NAD+)